MMNIRDAADLLQKSLKQEGAEKYFLLTTESETREFNVENGEFSLYRTVMSQSCTARVIAGGRTGAASGNDLSEEGIRGVAKDAMLSSASADVDEAHDVAEFAGKEVYHQGVYDPDMELFFTRMKELLETIRAEYPQILVMLATADHHKSHSIYRNSSGTEFEELSGSYDFGLEFAAKDGDEVTGIQFDGLTLTDLSKPFIQQGFMRKSLEDCIAGLNPQPVEGKFEGTIVLTPDALGSFLGMLMSNFASGSVIMDGTSLWLDKVGEKVAGEALSVSFLPRDPRIVIGDLYTMDGYKAEDIKFIENGVLNTHLLSLYAANKTGRPVVKNECGSMIVEAGDQSLEEILSGIEDGLLVGGFSGGSPGANGEFSGVAKNSFRIKDGKVVCAVSETMINGNLAEIFKDIRGVSKEVLASGSSVLPYMAVGGVVISGK